MVGTDPAKGAWPDAGPIATKSTVWLREDAGSLSDGQCRAASGMGERPAMLQIMPPNHADPPCIVDERQGRSAFAKLGQCAKLIANHTLRSGIGKG